MDNKGVAGERPGSSDPQAAARKPYVAPEVRLLGRLSDRTLGIGGSNRDHGQSNNTKFGNG